ncbi:flagellar hook-basal body protein [Brevibacillus ruminantium]|uniref:Flagellar hook-basal body protein n=1 Tax=Brevibacillus ruminantium TaxID=2950604 RepID=A0ABY4WH84_9BACL|nr:flagellar hook-basal body protein [Brevibacillus ruminantium]USG65387.1 flagellar hook-basal body protein [Brevibacillus ruminantium]
MQSLNISTAALRSVQQALDNTANNLANVDTVGFKRRSASFSELLTDSMNEQASVDSQQRNSPAGLRIGSGVRLGLTKLDVTTGSMKVTDVPTDLMIEGDGYFLVSHLFRNADGELDDEYRLTRSGDFELSELADLPGFALVTPSGEYLVDENGNRITFENAGELTITPEGVVMMDGNEVAQLRLYKVDNPDQLQQIGNNQLLAPTLDDQKAPDFMPFAEGRIRQGALETSNVNVQEEMSQLLAIQRAYQLNSRAIGITDQMMGIANSLRSR